MARAIDSAASGVGSLALSIFSSQASDSTLSRATCRAAATTGSLSSASFSASFAMERRAYKLEATCVMVCGFESTIERISCGIRNESA